jgi:hypothetical protein
MLPAMWRTLAILALAGISVAQAAPPLPTSDLAGRERERFVEPPVGRMMYPAPSVAPQWDWSIRSKRCRSRGSAHRGTRKRDCR